MVLLRLRRPVTLGSACSGLATETHAVKHILKIPYVHKFMCDINPHVRRVLSNTFPECSLLHDACKDLPGASSVDLFVAGPPCQPWSAEGKQRRGRDPRAAVFRAVLHYVKTKRPKVVVLENVSRALCVAPKIQSYLDADYEVTFRVLNSIRFGVPQHRRRLYVVARAPLRVCVVRVLLS